VVERQDGRPLTDADSAKVTGIAQALTARRIPDAVALVPTPPAPNRLIQAIAVQTNPQRSPSHRAQTDAVRASGPRCRPVTCQNSMQRL
jgi:hypothetical protein